MHRMLLLLALASPILATDMAPAPAPFPTSGLYTSLAAKRVAKAEQSSGDGTCLTVEGSAKTCSGHLAHTYDMSPKDFFALNPSVCAKKGDKIPVGTKFCVSSAYTDLQAACTQASGSLTHVTKDQTCDALASSAGMTVAALQTLNPRLNCTKPQGGWAVCVTKAAGTSRVASAAARVPAQG